MVEKIVADLERFIRIRFQVKPDDQYFTPEVNLWEEGYVDSVGAVEMIAHLEQTYNVRLSQEVLFDPEFSRVSGIGRLVARALASLDDRRTRTIVEGGRHRR